MQQPVEKLNQLTFTRFLAALSVVFFHSGGDFGFFQIPSIFVSGLTSVSYFYVLSGFVMAYVYARPLPVKFELTKYWATRFARIYPVYIFAFLITCLYYINIVPKTRLKEFLAHLFLYQAWIPEYSVSYNITAWSLSVEVFFYILVPFLVSWLSKISIKRIIFLSLVFWIFSQVVHSFLLIMYFPKISLSFLGYFPLFHLNAFILGFAGGIWYLNRPTNQRSSTLVNLLLLFISAFVIFTVIYFHNVWHILGKTFSINVGLLAPFFLISILALASDVSFLSKILSHRWFVLLGDSSYALYILHVPFRWWLERVFNRFSISLPYEIFLSIYILVTVFLSILIYRYIEIPAKKWIRDNPSKLLFVFLDIGLIVIVIKLAFVLRLGLHDLSLLKTQRFTTFFGTVIFSSLMIAFQFYKTYSWCAIGLASFLGSGILTTLTYYAWQAGWVEGFPRLILIMIPFWLFFSIYFSRFFINKWRMFHN